MELQLDLRSIQLARSYTSTYIMALPTAMNGSMNYRSNFLHFAGCFVFGDIKGVVTTNDLADIFGIPNKGKILEYTGTPGEKTKKTTFMSRYLSDMVDCVTKTRIEASIRNIVAGRSNEERADFARLVSTQISWKLVVICENLDQIQTYNWAAAIAECYKSLVHASKPHLVTGCVPALLFWFGGKTRLLTPIIGRENKLPNFVRWGLFQLHKTLINMDLKNIGGTPLMKMMHCLPETQVELELLHIRTYLFHL
ncbi:hypothetical protein DVH24_016627 [Malus domestica]|uniref:Uncharacterized protein n=1 Tax=Malus domestica TaxID=3750 RepID=A0A498HW91_MALDO|nr:hypothetical protein DVH24_016627 [Malus domestica]